MFKSVPVYGHIKYVPNLIPPVEGYRQDIYWFLNADSETGRICLGFSRFCLCLSVLVFNESRACALQGGPGVRGAKGHRGDPGPKVLFIHLTDARVLGLSLLHGNLEMNSRLSLVFLRKNVVKCHWHLLSLFKTCPICSLIKDTKFRMLLSQHKSSYIFSIYKESRQF